MLLQLSSDFRDYYDVYFAGRLSSAPVFSRASRTNLPRAEAFKLLEAAGYPTPQHGPVTELYERLCTKWYRRHDWTEQEIADFERSSGFIRMVVYTDPYAHAGEGKVFLTGRTAVEAYPNHYASEFVMSVPSYTASRSFRQLQIGRRTIFLMYESPNDWRSNAGDCEITILGSGEIEQDNVLYPLYAVDYLVPDNTAYAIDFNTAPQLRGTGIEDTIPARVIVDLISEWYDNHPDFDPGAPWQHNVRGLNDDVVILVPNVDNDPCLR
jgi:hypothetical protein